MEIDDAETSKELDPTTSLYYFGASYYSPWSGTWLSVDPLAKKYPGWSDPTSAATPSLVRLRRDRLLKRLLLPNWETARLSREDNCPEEAEGFLSTARM